MITDGIKLNMILGENAINNKYLCEINQRLTLNGTRTWRRCLWEKNVLDANYTFKLIVLHKTITNTNDILCVHYKIKRVDKIPSIWYYITRLFQDLFNI